MNAIEWKGRLIALPGTWDLLHYHAISLCQGPQGPQLSRTFRYQTHHD